MDGVDPTGQLSKLGEYGGLLGSLLALAITAIVFMFAAIRTNFSQQLKQRDDFEATLKQLFEARIAELRSTSVASERGTAALVELTKTMDNRTGFLERMNSLIERLSTTIETNRTLYKDQLDRIERAILGGNNKKSPE